MFLRSRAVLAVSAFVCAFLLLRGLLPAEAPLPITVDYPRNASVFPPDFAPPTFLFRDSVSANTRWKAEIRFADGGPALIREVAGDWMKVGAIDYRTIAPTNKLPELTPQQSATRTWKPDPATWEELKRRSVDAPATVVFRGYSASSPGIAASEGALTLSTAKNPVGAPVFFRDVPLMPAEQEKGLIRPLPPAALPLVAWRLRYVDENASRTLLEDMPTCANCHSFSSDGKTLGMDLDGPANDKGLYALVPIEKTMTIDKADVIAWSNFRGKLGGKMRVGFMSQVSPAGDHVVTMVNSSDFGFETDAPAASPSAAATTSAAATLPRLPKDVQGNFYVANFTDYRFLQVFYPTRGILAWYSRATGKLQPLPGADDPNFVHTNVTWSPDGKYIVFARAKARQPYPPGVPLATVSNDPNETPVQYDLYRIPFNQGKGGKAEPIRGASANGMSNSFPKISPDGRWLVYVQARNGLLMRPDSQLYIVPVEGGTPRRMNANTPLMNSWHSFSPNGRWLAFTSKSRSPYTQLFLTHIDENGDDSPAILVEDATAANRAVNIPEFVNIAKDEWLKIDTPATEFYRRSDAAFALMQKGDFPSAIKAWEEALSMEPGDVAALSNLGTVYSSIGRHDDAAAQFRKALDADPQNYKTQSNLGVALARLGKTAEAIGHLRKSLELNAGEVQTYTALGSVLSNLERYPEARALIEQALEIDPLSTDALNNLGGIFARQGDFAAAIPQFQKALTVDARSPVTLLNLGRAQAATGLIAEGLRNVERADQLAAGQDPTIAGRLADLYASQSRFAEAAATARRASTAASRAGDSATAQAMTSRAAEYAAKAQP
ncbi:MAG: tetratricopeptide repeat protein [Bryobacterales bacterium]|nr:tetratricopeptide repeat protein [Bryobacterales bacterium]